jgi:hypothetical protein
VSNGKQGGRISVGDITNSTGVAIGPGARSSVRQQAPADAAQVAAMLRELTGLIDAHAGELGDAGPVREAVAAACEEAASPRPRWPRVTAMLGLIGPAVARVAELTEAVANIRALIPR